VVLGVPAVSEAREDLVEQEEQVEQEELVELVVGEVLEELGEPEGLADLAVGEVPEGLAAQVVQVVQAAQVVQVVQAVLEALAVGDQAHTQSLLPSLPALQLEDTKDLTPIWRHHSPYLGTLSLSSFCLLFS
jgi:hypothetical protein